MALQNIFFLHYNNYYNRIIKKEETLDEYLRHQVGNPLLNTNFNPNDGVNAVHIVNWAPEIPETMPDYCVVQEIDGGSINSCWFVIEAVRTLKGQMQFTLRRDLVADFYQEVMNSTAFIEKATLSETDPFIFNREDFTVNQIKKAEHLLKDPSGVPWIIGYLDSSQEESIALQTSSKYEPYAVKEKSYFTQYTGIGVWYKGVISSKSLKIITNATPGAMVGYTAEFNFYTNQKTYNTYAGSQGTGINFTAGINNTDALQATANYLSAQSIRYSSGMNIYIETYAGARSNYEVEEFLKYNNKIIQDPTTGNYFKVKIIETLDEEKQVEAPQGSDIRDTMITIIKESIIQGANLQLSLENPSGLYFKYSLKRYVVQVADFIPGKVSVKIDGTRQKLHDAPYDMFAIPYESINVVGNYNFTTNAENSWIAAQAIAKKFFGAKALYDLQLLPYCPLTGVVKNGNINLSNMQEDVDYNIITYQSGEETPSSTSVILWAERSNFSINIPFEIAVSELKVENQCDFYRLSSPNYSGIFEFSAAKNGGVNWFNVDCTYKPISPYIHINPDFGGLYGSDWNDSRGLVCTGDFSLPIVTDAWETYQIQNKNFSEIFARQVQNMEVNNAVQREREIWGAVAGAVGGATTGGITGSMVGGGPIGATVGAVAGGALSAAAGIRDVQLSDKLRSEALDYTKDMYGYNLGNIQALPNSLAKTSAITENNKKFPFLEYYSCTDEEKQAFREKLKYNGMTVMRIDTIGKYLQLEKSYIKARIIRIEDLTDEFHLLNEIAAEMAKGVFI